MQQELFKGRDKRKKGWFWLDNEYLNGYAKHFGAVGTAIYVSLCRHADNETQTCFPSQKTIANELGISERTVRTYLAIFERNNLIKITKEKHPINKKWLNNVYYLLDKSEWKKPEAIVSSGKPEANDDKSHRQQLPSNKTHKINKTHIRDLKCIFEKEIDITRKDPRWDIILQEEKSKFLDYWTEKSSSGSKERWQKEKVFDVKRRWSRWIRNLEAKMAPRRYEKIEPDHKNLERLREMKRVLFK